MRLRKVCVVVRICMHVWGYKGCIDYTNSALRLPKFPRANAVNKHEKSVRHLGATVDVSSLTSRRRRRLDRKSCSKRSAQTQNGMIEMAASECIIN